MSAGFRVRPMQTADIDAVLRVAAMLPHAPHWPRAAYQAALDAAAPPRIALVAEPEQGVVAGFAIASLMPPEAELETIAIAQDWQRRGLGRLLLNALADVLHSRGAGILLLEVRASNSAALRLYRAAGFAQTGCRPRYYADPEEDALLWQLSLG